MLHTCSTRRSVLVQLMNRFTPRITATFVKLICAKDNTIADVTHAPCGAQAFLLIGSYSITLWYTIMSWSTMMVVYRWQLPVRWRTVHIASHLLAWTPSIVIAVVTSAVDIIESDDLGRCFISEDKWASEFLLAFVVLPEMAVLLAGLACYLMVLARVAWVLRTRALVKGASIRMLLFLVYGFCGYLFESVVYFITIGTKRRRSSDEDAWIDCAARSPTLECNYTGFRVPYGLQIAYYVFLSTQGTNRQAPISSWPVVRQSLTHYLNRSRCVSAVGHQAATLGAVALLVQAARVAPIQP